MDDRLSLLLMANTQKEGLSLMVSLARFEKGGSSTKVYAPPYIHAILTIPENDPEFVARVLKKHKKNLLLAIQGKEVTLPE